MKISQLMRDLDEIRKTHGDLDLGVEDNSTYSDYRLLGVETYTRGYGTPREACIKTDIGPYCQDCGRGCDA